MNVSKRQRTGREGRWKSERGGVFSPLQHFFYRLFVSAVERVHKQSSREEGFEEKEKGDKKKCVPARHASVLSSFCSASLLQSGLKGGGGECT